MTDTEPVRIPKKLLEKVRKEAKETDRNVSNMMAHILKKYFENDD